MYGSINESTEDNTKDAYNWAAFVGYQNTRFSVGAEYNIYQNVKFKEDADQYGFSVYGTVKLSDVVEIYARHDKLSSKDDWNISKDESATMLGAQFKVCKYVKIAPNVRMNVPLAGGVDESKYSAYVSCYFGL